MENDKNKIIVIYIGVTGVREEDIETYVQKITEKISPTSISAEIITIPVNSYETKIECINPKYITDESLINEHTKLMKELHEELKHQINELKKYNESNGSK